MVSATRPAWAAVLLLIAGGLCEETIVAADTPFRFDIDYHEATWSGHAECLGPDGCDFKYLRAYLWAAPPSFDDDYDLGVVMRTYCKSAPRCLLNRRLW
ncbi:hypothetical protein B0I35DRAFT_435159 [Stachybotrys elegans]|uniref:Uncharacterized protein n=1 Tax=Stachybotrys elegans TaxID=80388 RepID=A0A8K0WQ73_9HYPO|nr:hypothetical protein B0I35DRAFT_435159 [Stachybotrys elegans]